MDPRITDLREDNDTLFFKLTNANVSVANAIRRTILSDINTVCFITTPHSQNNSVFNINTSRMNNELLKQRLSSIPIHITDEEFPLEEYILEVNVKNETEETIYVTTKDFKIKNITTEKYLTETATRDIFPPNNITGDFIDFVRLRPRLGDNSLGEEINLTCKFSRSNANHNSMFNVVSACSYGYTPDAVEINKQWTLKEKELTSSESKETIEYLKKDWLLLDAQRYTVPNSFDFTIETVGVYENMQLVQKACNILIEKLIDFDENIQKNDTLITLTTTTMANSYDIILENEDYTLGKVIEWFMYYNYYLGNETANFCGFQKKHPHDRNSIVRIAFKEPTEKHTLIQLISTACEQAKTTFEKIMRELSDEKVVGFSVGESK